MKYIHRFTVQLESDIATYLPGKWDSDTATYLPGKKKQKKRNKNLALQY